MVTIKNLKSILSSKVLVDFFITNYATKGITLLKKDMLSSTKPSKDNKILYSSYVLRGTGCSISFVDEPEPAYRFEQQDKSAEITLWTLLAQARPDKLVDVRSAKAYLGEWFDGAIDALQHEPDDFFVGARTLTRHIRGYDPSTNIKRRMTLAAGKEMNVHNINTAGRDDLDARIQKVEPRFSDKVIRKWILRHLGSNIAELVMIPEFENFYVMPAIDIPVPDIKKVEVSPGKFEERTEMTTIRLSVPMVHYFGGGGFVDEFRQELQQTLDYLIVNSSRQEAERNQQYSEEHHQEIMGRMHSDATYLKGLRLATLDPKEQAVRNALLSVYLTHVEDMGVFELHTKNNTPVPEANAKHIVEHIFTPGTNVLDTEDIVLVEDITRYCIKTAFKKGLQPSITGNSVRANGLEVIYVGRFAPKTHRRYVNTWLQSDEGVTYLKSDHGKSWFESPDSEWWRYTPAGEAYAASRSDELLAVFSELADGDLNFKSIGPFQPAEKKPIDD